MASGTKMSYNHFQGGKYGGFSQPSQKDMEITQDMHLKMSKKIAQLTKVIYALNTKNDENDTVLQSLKDQHEEEIQRILADTQKKVSVYKCQLDEESDHRKTIEALQTKMDEYKDQKTLVENQFAAYKTKISELHEKERESYANRLFDMSHEMLKAKKDFEDHIQRFISWKERIIAEHATAIAEQESKHRTEMEDLKSLQRDQDDTWQNQCAKIEERFKSQIEALRNQVEALQNEKVSMETEYVAKLEKSQAFYEKELEAVRHSQSQGHNMEVEKLRKEIDRMKLDFGANERELRSQIDRLVRQLADTEDELEQVKQEKEMLQAELAGKKSSSSELSKHLQDLKEELAKKTTSLQNTETELAGSKQHCSNLADELMKKSNKMGELEAHNVQNEGVISSLRSELDKMKDRVTRLDAERSSLQSHAQSLSLEQSSQLQNLRQALEDMTVEKETLKQWSEKQIQSLNDELEKREKKLKEEFHLRLTEMEVQQREAIERERKEAGDVLASTKASLTEQHEEIMRQMVAEKVNLQQQLEHLRTELSSKLVYAEQEIARLEKIVKDSEEGLGSASGQLANLRDAATQLKAELDKTRSDLKESTTKTGKLQAELDKLKELHDRTVAEMEADLKVKLRNLSQELDTKWTETMREECGNLRRELTAQKEDEKRAALSHLAQLKNEEIEAVRAGLDSRVAHLRRQIEDLQSQLDNSKTLSEAERSRLESSLEREKDRLRQEMLEAASEYASQIEMMKKMHDDEMARFKSQLEQEKNSLENELKLKHLEEMQAQVSAHKAALSHSSQLEQRQRQEALDNLKVQQLKEIEKLQAELEEQNKNEMEALKLKHGNEVRAARMELERAVEISKQKDKDHQMQLEELKTEIGYREQHIKNLQDQLTKVQEQISKLKQEIDTKVLEIKQTQKQASQQLKIQEDKLNRENQTAINNLTADHLREQQDMLAQFNAAQAMLKDKISALQIELQEARDRYDRRESRPEDLELIDSLRSEVSEREIRIKDLIDEKRFYQLELVNRETNFNKVFNASPNVGVLNPFQKPKKKGEKTAGVQRLDPLPGSPLHDGKLNPTKPLPQPNFTKFSR
ncbi:protein FAM184A-like [Physella acuta]|uniref:protein FAM184A-like n=1 Tax=Physella acuta TaxID=109671 RepID=UPI0027DAD710|nr:protein FAM184A-like [Physella acuta]